MAQRSTHIQEVLCTNPAILAGDRAPAYGETPRILRETCSPEHGSVAALPAQPHDETPTRREKTPQCAGKRAYGTDRPATAGTRRGQTLAEGPRGTPRPTFDRRSKLA